MKLKAREGMEADDLVWFLRHIESILSSLFMAPESLMGKIDRLKSKKCGVDNYTRFLAPLDDVMKDFVN